MAAGAPSLRLLASLGITDSANPMLGLEPLVAARPHYAPLNLVETLDRLVMEKGWIG